MEKDIEIKNGRKMNEIEKKALKVITDKECNMFAKITIYLWILNSVLIILYYFKINNFSFDFSLRTFLTIIILIIFCNSLISIFLSLIITDIFVFLTDKEYRFAKKVVNKFETRIKELDKKKELNKIIIKHKKSIKNMKEFEEYIKEGK